MRWLREPTLAEKLDRQLAEAKQRRIYATAQLSLWKNDERFRLAEISRLAGEIELLIEETEAASVPDAAKALLAASAAVETAVGAVRRIH